MLSVGSPLGNIFEETVLQDGSFERLKVSRAELEKRILRKESDQGTDVGINLEHGTRLRHGDVIGGDKVKIVVEQAPEKVMCVRIKDTSQSDIVFLLGHIIGNRHRPISIKGDEITFPIQADSEVEVFRKLFSSIIDSIHITTSEEIFLPHKDADVHGH